MTLYFLELGLSDFSQRRTMLLLKAQLLEKYCPDKLNVRNAVLTLDKFYDDYQNRHLIVSEALCIIKMQMTGQSNEAIERELGRISKTHEELKQ